MAAQDSRATHLCRLLLREGSGLLGHQQAQLQAWAAQHPVAGLHGASWPGTQGLCDGMDAQPMLGLAQNTINASWDSEGLHGAWLTCCSQQVQRGVQGCWVHAEGCVWGCQRQLRCDGALGRDPVLWQAQAQEAEQAPRFCCCACTQV